MQNDLPMKWINIYIYIYIYIKVLFMGLFWQLVVSDLAAAKSKLCLVSGTSSAGKW